MKQTFQLDETDIRILKTLQRDAALSQAALAEQVGASPASCWRRIRSLEGAGVLRQTVRLVDPAAIGRDVNVLCQVRLKAHSDENRHAFERFVALRDEIMECYSTSGEWDYELRVVVADVAAYESFLMRVLLHQSMIATAASRFALAQIKYTTALPV
jgi:Lrp/AsnC family transcriptional regulator